MADQWYIAREKKRDGPHSLDQMKRLAASGTLLPIDMVWQEGMSQWVPASQVEAIFSPTGITAAPPPLPGPRAAEPAEWHFTQSGQQAGPVTWTQLRQRAASGQLQPTDMAWKNGMPAWAAAGSVPNLFPPPTAAAPPPPLPPVPVAGSPPALVERVTGQLTFQGGGPGAEDQQIDILFDGQKVGVGSCKGGFGLAFETTAGHHTLVLAQSGMMKKVLGTAGKQRAFPLDLQRPGHYDITFSYPRKMGGVLGGFLAGLKGGATGASVETHNLPTEVQVNHSPQARRLPGAVQIDPNAEPTEAEEGLVPKMLRERKEAARQALLHGLWEPVTGQALSFMFTKDGAMLRGDGFATKFRWVADDKIELYADDTDKTAQFTILSLGQFEMILKAGEQSGHFKKGVTITEAELRRRQEEARKRAKETAENFKNVAFGVASVLATGGFAVLCGAAAVGMAGGVGDGGGGGSPGRNFREIRCDYCNGTGRTGTGIPQEICIGCGGHGVKRISI
jgi:hypothetical protein